MLFITVYAEFTKVASSKLMVGLYTRFEIVAFGHTSGPATSGVKYTLSGLILCPRLIGDYKRMLL